MEVIKMITAFSIWALGKYEAGLGTYEFLLLMVLTGYLDLYLFKTLRIIFSA